MTVTVPFDIGDKITIDNKSQTIKGMHIYIDGHGNISNLRVYTGNGFAMAKRTQKGAKRDE